MEEQKRNPAAGLSESEQVQVRRQKLADLQAAGHDPFTLTKFPQDAYSADLKEEFKDLPNETDSGKKAALAGRMMSKRVMGKASFAHLRDDKGDIQLYVRRDELGEESYAAFKKLDVGDIIGVKGEVFRTKTGELSVRAEELTLLAKSLRPLPEKFHGLTDTETRYRQRYVDLIANPEVKETFVKRSQILKEIRAYLDEKGFLEVDTPILTPFEIGASARPFYTHHNTLNMDMVLRIETELYLKRLIVGGMDRVYEVGRIFRNEGMDPKHNPEFTTIELYQAFTDFHGMMDLVEELYKRLALKICGGMVIPYQGKQIDMGHWERLTMIEAVKKYSGVDFNDWKTDEDAIAAAKEHHVELPEVPTKGAILAEFFDAFVEDKLIQPTFIYDYPVEISPLAKRKPDDPAFTERFEYFIDCTEYGNAFTDKTGAFVEANGGTLFLDEVGNLSYDVQVQLLRAIQERKIRPVGSNQEIEVDVRLVCATNENLQQAIARGEFREDLYHRLNEFTLHMPSLKDRGEDILLFANFFLDQANKELERHIVGFDAPASEALLNYAWPGNLRELKNRVKRATLLAQDRLIHKTDLGEFNIINRGEEALPAATPFALHDKNTERERILQALQTAHHNKARAARLLGIDRKTLYNKIKLYDIPQ